MNLFRYLYKDRKMKQKHDLLVTFGPITKDNVDQVRKINSASFPIQYNNTFYNDIIKGSSLESFDSSIVEHNTNENFRNGKLFLNQVAYVNGAIVGAYCSQIESYHHHQNTIISKTTDKNNNLTKKRVNPNVATFLHVHEKSETTQLGLYLMTLAVLAPYRGRGIGSQLLQHLIEQVSKCNNTNTNHCSLDSKEGQDIATATCNATRYKIQQISLHVQISNNDAIRWYTSKRFGFTIGPIHKNYYNARIVPPHCYLLYKEMWQANDDRCSVDKNDENTNILSNKKIKR